MNFIHMPEFGSRTKMRQADAEKLPAPQARHRARMDYSETALAMEHASSA